MVLGGCIWGSLVMFLSACIKNQITRLIIDMNFCAADQELSWVSHRVIWVVINIMVPFWVP